MAKIIAGWYGDGRGTGDFLGFAPDSQLTIYRTGGGKDNLDADIDYNNWKAVKDAVNLGYNPTDGWTKPDVRLIVNASILPTALRADFETMSDFAAGGYALSESQKKVLFADWINTAYDSLGANYATLVGNDLPSAYATNVLSGIGDRYSQMLIMPTGAF